MTIVITPKVCQLKVLLGIKTKIMWEVIICLVQAENEMQGSDELLLKCLQVKLVSQEERTQM